MHLAGRPQLQRAGRAGRLRLCTWSRSRGRTHPTSATAAASVRGVRGTTSRLPLRRMQRQLELPLRVHQHPGKMQLRTLQPLRREPPRSSCRQTMATAAPLKCWTGRRTAVGTPALPNILRRTAAMVAMCIGSHRQRSLAAMQPRSAVCPAQQRLQQSPVAPGGRSLTRRTKAPAEALTRSPRVGQRAMPAQLLAPPRM